MGIACTAIVVQRQWEKVSNIPPLHLHNFSINLL